MKPPESQSKITTLQALSHKFIVLTFVAMVVACIYQRSFGPLVPWLIVALFLIALFDGRRSRHTAD